MFQRCVAADVLHGLQHNPAVVLLGARQTGKTTLARHIAAQQQAVYLDLQRPADLARLSDAESFLQAHSTQLIILDEVQRLPDIFKLLRGVIDRRRFAGQQAGHFLLLGSARGKLLAQTSESLAGRVTYTEMTSLLLEEVAGADPALAVNTLWQRGGFPGSYLASDAAQSFTWRLDLLRSYLEQDIRAYVPRAPSTTLQRLLSMLANEQGGLLNLARLAGALQLSGSSVARYIDLFVDLFLVRRLLPYHLDTNKRLVRAPRLYVRDSGLAHALLSLQELNAMLGHAAVGGSWEGFVLEQLIAAAPRHSMPFFYRTARGAEIDLLLQIPKHGLWAYEIKRDKAPSLSRGFYEACNDTQPSRKTLLYSGPHVYTLRHAVQVTPLWQAVADLRRCT